MPFVGEKIALEAKIQYLQIVQKPTSRMSTISAIYKGFAATIVAGIATITYREIALWILGLSFIPLILFAFRDIYYLKLYWSSKIVIK